MKTPAAEKAGAVASRTCLSVGFFAMNYKVQAVRPAKTLGGTIFFCA